MTDLQHSHSGITATDGPTCCARLHLLGGFELRVAGAPVLVQPTAQRLLALLALMEAAVERSFAAFRLWPDTSEDRARANLRSTLWRLRQAPVGLVQTSKTHLRLSRSVWVDVHDELDEDRTEHPGQDTALHVELLPDWYDDWLIAERERIRQLHLHSLELRVDRLLDAGRHGEAIQLGLRASAMEPLRESPHRLVVRAHLAEGNLVEAVRQYDRYARLLDDEVGAEPSELMWALMRGLDGCSTSRRVSSDCSRTTSLGALPAARG
jgi:DNA-binding SARP family transcriptional activator